MSAIRKAAEEWLDQFNFIPGSIFEKLAEHDEAIDYFDSNSLRLIASPRILCSYCGAEYEGELSMSELRKQENILCEFCYKGSTWEYGFPEYAFPCGWSTLFNPPKLDQDWIENNKEKVAKLGFFIFKSEDFGILLGIDAGGFDFYEAYWIPLYKTRGFKWHENYERSLA